MPGIKNHGLESVNNHLSSFFSSQPTKILVWVLRASWILKRLAWIFVLNREGSVLMGTAFMNELFIVAGNGKERPKPNDGVVIIHGLSSVPHDPPTVTALEGLKT